MYSSPVHFNFFFPPSVPAAYNNNTFASSPVFFSSSFYYFKLTIILIAVCQASPCQQQQQQAWCISLVNENISLQRSLSTCDGFLCHLSHQLEWPLFTGGYTHSPQRSQRRKKNNKKENETKVHACSTTIQTVYMQWHLSYLLLLFQQLIFFSVSLSRPYRNCPSLSTLSLSLSLSPENSTCSK